MNSVWQRLITWKKTTRLSWFMWRMLTTIRPCSSGQRIEHKLQKRTIATCRSVSCRSFFSYSSHDFHASHPFVCPTSCCLLCCLPPILLRGSKAFDFLLIFFILPHEKVCSWWDFPFEFIYSSIQKSHAFIKPRSGCSFHINLYLMNFRFDPEGIVCTSTFILNESPS